ncbi:MAG: pyridoxal-phosphate dependent enzyme, partial [Spirochaetaceae bacterium]
MNFTIIRFDMSVPNHLKPRFICKSSSEYFPVDTYRWQGTDGGLLDIEFEAVFPKDKILKRPPGMWRYREALPFPVDAEPVSFGEGFTPMPRVTVHGCEIFLKQEQLFPSGSYKDRGATLLVSHAKRIGVRHCVEDSSGNAGSAIAAYCARAGITCEIYVPADTSPGKLAQIRAYGAQLTLIPGSREATADAVRKAATTSYYASHVWNPFFFHGTKTFAYEIWEQLGFRAPDAVVLPVGNGTLLLGTAIGFEELRKAGEIERLPKIFGVQAERCAPLLGSESSNKDRLEITPSQQTIAEGIAIARPARGRQILEALNRCDGRVLSVGEEEILASLQRMCRQGFFIEPTSAATLAAI